MVGNVVVCYRKVGRIATPIVYAYANNFDCTKNNNDWAYAIRPYPMNNPTVDIVIPAYNCEETIEKALDAVCQQSYSNVMNVIVVDDGSMDNTARIIKRFSKVQYVYQNNAGPATARNRGVREATAEVVFFTDADCVAEIHWIEKMIGHFKDSAVAVVAGSYGILNGESRLARCIHGEIIFRHHRLMLKYARSFGSYNFGIRKNIFEQVGGFNQGYRSASGEDNDLSYKILNAGHKMYFECDALVGHTHPMRVVRYLYEQYRHGFWRVKMYVDHLDKIQGDDYTFWKDIVEVPIVFGVVFGIIWGCVFDSFLIKYLVVSLLGFLICLEFVYGFMMAYKKIDAFFLSGIMFLRAFVRCAGFSSGIMNFLLKIKTKKGK